MSRIWGTSHEDSFNDLVKLRNSQFNSSAVDVLYQIDVLKQTNVDVIKNDYLGNIVKYKQWLQKVSPTVFKNGGNVAIFKTHENEYNLLNKKIDEINKSINGSIQDVKKSIDRLILEELLSSLRAISVDELARDKSGLRVKNLKEAGYDNLADIYVASAMEIASVYGISQDRAYTVKKKCDSFVNDLRKEIKIKLSIDDKSKAATKVVQAIYIYLKKRSSRVKSMI